MICSQFFLQQIYNNSVLPVAIQKPPNGPLLKNHFYHLLLIPYMADIIVTISLYYLAFFFDFSL